MTIVNTCTQCVLNLQTSAEDSKKTVSTDFAADMPIDLATLYARKGGVDLSTLSELTKSVGAAEGDGTGSRSKRTCVRVRQEISKLQEILNEDTSSDVKPGKVSGGKSRGRNSGGGVASRSSLGPKVVELDDDALSGSGLLPSAKKKRSTYSQFTHKRRKRKKKQMEEGKWRYWGR